MTQQIYERGVDTTELFRIEAANDGGYFAVRDATREASDLCKRCRTKIEAETLK